MRLPFSRSARALRHSLAPGCSIRPRRPQRDAVGRLRLTPGAPIVVKFKAALLKALRLIAGSKFTAAPATAHNGVAMGTPFGLITTTMLLPDFGQGEAKAKEMLAAMDKSLRAPITNWKTGFKVNEVTGEQEEEEEEDAESGEESEGEEADEEAEAEVE